MARFRYTALDREEKPHRGLLEARDQISAIQTLSTQFSLVTDLDLVRPGLAESFRSYFQPGVSRDELLIFTQQLAAVVNAGLPLKTALQFVVGDSRNPAFVRTIEQVCESLDRGTTLADSLQPHTLFFPIQYVAMVKAGEASGKLPFTLEQLGRHLESSGNLEGKIKGAFAYPLIVVVFAAVLTFCILTVGMPMVKNLYSSLGGTLPGPTRAMLSLSEILSGYWWACLGGALGLCWLLRRALRNESNALAVDRWKLKLPVLGGIFHFLVVARFARTFGSVFSAGVPILEALELTAPATGNRVFRKHLAQVSKQVADGAPLSDSLRGTGFLPPLALGMISSGEATGTLVQMLGRVATFYETRLEMMLKSLTAMVEPILMIGVGLLLGTLILCVGLPFLNLSMAM